MIDHLNTFLNVTTLSTHPIILCDLCEWIWLGSYLTSESFPDSSNSAFAQHESLRLRDAGDHKAKVT